ADAITQISHHLGIRSDKYNPEFFTKAGQLRMFSDKSPTRPDRIGAGADQSLFEQAVVEIPCALPGASCLRQSDGLVGLPHEQGAAIGFMEQRNGAKGSSVLLIEFARRMDETQSSRAPVDNGYALELADHKPPDQYRVTSGNSQCSGHRGLQ